MTTMTEAPPTGKRPKPHKWLGEPLPPRVQPPAKFAHLSGDDLHDALIKDGEIWTVPRVALEAGRSKRTVDKWLGYYVKFAAGERPLDDNTIIRPTYVETVATWRAGDVREWMMRTRKMRRNGVFIPYKPAGRPKGRTERARRPKRGSDMNEAAPALLAEYNELVGDCPRADHPRGEQCPKPRDGRHVSAKAARAQLARKHQISDRQVIRWLQRGRDLAAGRTGSH